MLSLTWVTWYTRFLQPIFVPQKVSGNFYKRTYTLRRVFEFKPLQNKGTNCLKTGSK